ncbi:hypothetical protein RhiirA5_367983, partial [Rhizophagus irregularis]
MFARRKFCAADVTNSRIRFVVSSRCGLCCSSYGFGVGVCQVHQKDVELRSSIGIFEFEGTSGTLSAVVRDKISDQIGILPSCLCETTTTPKHTGIDTAYCTFTNTNRTLCPNKCSVLPEEFKKVNLPGNTCINCFYKCAEFDNDIDDCNIFKVGRATGLTLGNLLPIGVAVSIDLTNKSIKYAKEQDKMPT